jgi:ribonuclease HI
MLEDENTLSIYTDGSCLYTDKHKGGVGIVFLYTKEDGSLGEYQLPALGYRAATSPEMELQACIIALAEVAKNPLFERCQNVIIRTDAQYLVDNYLRAELFWSRGKNKWKKASGEPVALAPLWKQFLKAKRRLGKRLELQKVKAHAKNQHNVLADKRARKSAKEATNPPLRVMRLGRKYSDQPTIKGCVPMRGQVLVIHMIQGIYEHEHNLDRCRYEVFDHDKGKFHEVDWIYSASHLERCHCYRVQVNSDQGFPQIAEVLGEVENPARRASPPS